MKGLYARRWAITVITVGGLGVILAATIARWSVWVPPATVLVCLSLISLLSVRPRRERRTRELYASDPYSDAYLGRPQPTHPYSETGSTAQIGEPLPRDPLELPPKQ